MGKKENYTFLVVEAQRDLADYILLVVAMRKELAAEMMGSFPAALPRRDRAMRQGLVESAAKKQVLDLVPPASQGSSHSHYKG
jgi:hypothetical protein